MSRCYCPVPGLHARMAMKGLRFCFILKMYFSLPQLFVFLSDVFSVAVFVIRDKFVNHTNYVLIDFKCHCVTALYLACMPAWQ